MTNYRVYFNQENQTYYDVSAQSEGAAIKKAERLWRDDHKYPTLGAVEEQES